MRMTQSNLKTYPGMMFVDQVTKVCSVLEPLGITFFAHTRTFSDSTGSILCNNNTLMQAALESELFQNARFSKPPECYQNGYYLWQHETLTEKEAQHTSFLAEHHIGNGITIIRKDQKTCNFFHFASTPDNTHINQFYLNNLDLLEQFIEYFLVKTRELSALNDKVRVQLTPNPKDVEFRRLTNNPVVDPQLRADFLSTLRVERFLNRKHHVFGNLTQRQSECLYWLMRGKSAAQTAEILNLSPRTIEHYWQNIRKKLNCDSKLSLMSKVLHECPDIEALK